MGGPWSSKAGPGKQGPSHHASQGAGLARRHQVQIQPQESGTFLGLGLGQDISLQPEAEAL